MGPTLRVAIHVAEPIARAATILVMSEDQEWRAVLRRVLEREGYGVLEARHAGHALVTSMRHDGWIDLLVSDGSAGRRRSDFSPRLFLDRPLLQLLHLEERPKTRDELLAAVTAALS